MPSLPDSDVVAPAPARGRPGPTAPGDILARVKADGLRRRTRRHRRNSLLAVLGLALVAVPVVTLLPGGDSDEDVTVAAEPEPTTTTPTTAARRTTTTAAPVTTVPTTIVVPNSIVQTPVPDPNEVGLIPPTSIVRRPPPRTTPTTARPPTAPPPTTTPPTTVPPCQNSTEARCGEFRWDPDPGPNSALSASVQQSTATPTVNEPVELTVSWSDDDASLTFRHVSVDDEPALAQPCTSERRHGPWTPPARRGGSNSFVETVTFATAGEHVVTFHLATADCNNPYGSEVSVRAFVSVQEPPPETQPEP